MEANSHVNKAWGHSNRAWLTDSSSSPHLRKWLSKRIWRQCQILCYCQIVWSHFPNQMLHLFWHLDLLGISLKLSYTRVIYHFLGELIHYISCHPISRFHCVQPTLHITPTIFIITIRLTNVQASNKGNILWSYKLLWHPDIPQFGVPLEKSDAIICGCTTGTAGIVGLARVVRIHGSSQTWIWYHECTTRLIPYDSKGFASIKLVHM